jgi:hypothetical protein
MFLRHQHTALLYPFPVVTHISNTDRISDRVLSLSYIGVISQTFWLFRLFVCFISFRKKNPRLKCRKIADNHSTQYLLLITWWYEMQRCARTPPSFFFLFRGDYFFSPSSSSSSSSSSGINNVLLSSSK